MSNKEEKLTNKEWLATLPKETWWEVCDWLLHEYGKSWTDTRLAVMDWIDQEHKPIKDWQGKVRWE